MNFKIVDNTGGESAIDSVSVANEDNDTHSYFLENCRLSGLIYFFDDYYYSSKIIPIAPCDSRFPNGWRGHYIIPHSVREFLFKDICYRIFLTLAIPKDDIMKYSNFEIITPKNK
jgi:hypothetical protein